MKLAALNLAASLSLGLAACSGGEQKSEAQSAATPPADTTQAAPASNTGGMNMAPAAKMAKGTGTVTEVSADSITLNHEPIAEAGWPAMTMAFKAAPEITKQVKVGDKVTFDVKLEGGGGEVTAVSKAP